MTTADDMLHRPTHQVAVASLGKYYKRRANTCLDFLDLGEPALLAAGLSPEALEEVRHAVCLLKGETHGNRKAEKQEPTSKRKMSWAERRDLTRRLSRPAIPRRSVEEEQEGRR